MFAITTEHIGPWSRAASSVCPAMSRARHWCFTLNNPKQSADELKALLAPHCKAAVFQLEEGESGTPHYQGYCQFNKRLRKPSKIIQAHWSVARDVQASIRYCQKADTRKAGPYVIGSLPTKTQGRRTDLEKLVELSKQRTSFRDLVQQIPETVSRYPRGARVVHDAFQPNKRKGKPTISLIIGGTGIGKSYYVYNLSEDLYTKAPGDKWFDGYEGQDYLHLEEYSGYLPLSKFLYLTDEYPDRRVEVKGGFRTLLATQIWLTTNIHPHGWYNWNGREQQYFALMRRFTHIYTIKDHKLVEIDKAEFTTDINNSYCD